MSDISKDGKVTVEQDQNTAKSGRGGEGVVDNAPISYFVEVQRAHSLRLRCERAHSLLFCGGAEGS